MDDVGADEADNLPVADGRSHRNQDGPGAMRLQAAEAYAGRGWPVLPLWWPAQGGACACGRPDCSKPGKHPLIRRGFHAATTDIAVLRRWWARWPDANVGVRTGTTSGILVVDVDGERGMESLRALRQEHGQLRAAWVQTGSGGWHAYLRLPAGQQVPGSVGRLGPGLDVRGDGGFVVAPPSRHLSGGNYRWRRSPGDLPEAPAWVIELALPPPPPPMRPLTLRGQEVTERYAAAAINREAAAVAGAPEGTRNHRLNLAAFRLGRLVGGGVADEDVAREALLAAARTAGLSQHESGATIRSGLRAGMQRPRRPEPASPPAPVPIASPPRSPRP